MSGTVRQGNGGDHSLGSDFGTTATKNLKATGGRAFSFAAINSNAAARFLQLHDTATTPAGAAAPKYSFEIAAASGLVVGSDFFTLQGMPFALGIAYAFSTTKDTFTAATAADGTIQVIFQ